MKITIYNITQDKFIEEEVKIEDSCFKRLIGLMFKKKN